MVDAGHKSHAIDSGLPRSGGRDELDYRQRRRRARHPAAAPARPAALPELGDTVWLVPGHCDPTVNLHDHYVGVRGGLERGVVEAVWPIEARGCAVDARRMRASGLTGATIGAMKAPQIIVLATPVFLLLIAIEFVVGLARAAATPTACTTR